VTHAALIALLSPLAIWLAYRTGFGWRTPRADDPFPRTTFGDDPEQPPKTITRWGDDIRPGDIIPYD